MKHNITRLIPIQSPKISHPLTLAFVTDLHNQSPAPYLAGLQQADVILIGGDLVDRHKNTYHNALTFLDMVVQMAPTYYAIGNHERKLPDLAHYWPQVVRKNLTILDNSFCTIGDLVLGGLSSAKKVQTGFLQTMMAQPGYHLLSCHHPEYWRRYIKPYLPDLTLSGHAHGGQIRIGQQGLYAPGQGLFPRRTSGFYENNHLFVSRGMANATFIPRLRNPCEFVLFRFEPCDPIESTPAQLR